jgi:tetratricopeptide (TPR) repeat protein
MKFRKFALINLLLLSSWLVACTSAIGPSSIDEGGQINTEPTVVVSVPTLTSEPAPTATLSWETKFTEAQDLFRVGQWQAALDKLHEAKLINEGNDLLLVLEGQIYLAQQLYSQAQDAFANAILLNPENSTALFSTGLIFAAQMNYELALASFQATTDVAINFAPAYLERALIHEILGNYESAVLDYQIYLALVPNSPDRLILEDRILLLQGESGQIFEESVLLFFDDFSTTSGGWTRNGDADLAIEFVQDGMRLNLSDSNSAAWSLINRIFTDTSISVSATLQSGSSDNYFGLMCRIQGTTAGADFYMFMVSSDGYFGIAKRINGGELALLSNDKLQFSPDIPQGNESLEIRAECDEDRLALFVNGLLISEVYDAELGSGQAGVFVGTFADPGTDILFDDFLINALTDTP